MTPPECDRFKSSALMVLTPVDEYLEPSMRTFGATKGDEGGETKPADNLRRLYRLPTGRPQASR